MALGRPQFSPNLSEHREKAPLADNRCRILVHPATVGWRMEVTSSNGVNVYNISAGKAVPQWIQDKRKKGKGPMLKGLDKVELELIQEFGFKSTASKITQTRDGKYILAAGQYPPRIKVFSVDDLSLHFERGLNEEVVTFECLSEDFSKLVFLRGDRTLEFHDKGGIYYNLRIPIHGRAMTYHYPTCDLITVGNGNHIYRLNLEQGRFLRPLAGSSPAFNACVINPASGILAVGGNDGVLECWDPRDRSHLAAMKMETRFVDPLSALFDVSDKTSTSATTGITALRFSDNGLCLATGVATGHVLLYDLRMNAPFAEKDHQFDTPITDIWFHDSSRNVISSCKKVIRIWDRDTAKSFANVEPSFDISTTHVVPHSGMIMVGGENPRMNIYHIPDLAPAPKWASFLDNMTDELEANTNKTVYQDFKFLTREEIDRLGIGRLIGTPYLRAYMHGFFIDFRLFRKVHDIAKPDEYRDYLKQRVQEQLDKKRGSRISAQPMVKLGAKVNQEFLDQVRQSKGSDAASSLANDDRFSRIFQDPNMKIDTTSEAFARTHAGKTFGDVLAKGFSEVSMKSGANGYESDEVSDEAVVDVYGFTEEDQSFGERKHSKKDNEKKRERADPISSRLVDKMRDKDDDLDQEMPAKKKIRLMEATDADGDSPFAASFEKKKRQNASFASRLASEDVTFTTDQRVSSQGPLQLSYIPEADRREQVALKQARKEHFKQSKSRRSMRGLIKR